MPKAVNPDPAIHRRRLRNELRNAREAVGMTQRDVANAMDWSPAKVIRIESGAVNISTNDLRVLLSHYGVDSARIADLVDLARAARQPTRWSIYKNMVSPEFMAFLGYESSASIIWNFQPVFVPGLLQTEEYARTVISKFGRRITHTVDPMVNLRLERQELLVRQPSVELHFIMDEAVIHRMTGGRDAMRRQLRHLRNIAEGYPNVTIRIVPFELGFYPHQQGSYQVIELSAPRDEYVMYMEGEHYADNIRENFLGDEGEFSPIRYLEDFCELEQSLDYYDTLRLLQEAINRLESEPSSPASSRKIARANTQQAPTAQDGSAGKN